MTHSFPLLNRLFFTSILAALVLTSSCKREYDSPPERKLPIGDVLSIQELRNLYVNEPVRFEEDYSVYATVTADETTGNLYRNIFVEDDSAGINLRLLNPGGLYNGDRIRIYLPGTVLGKYQGMMQLDSVDVDNNIVKQATNVHVEPKDVTISEITPDLQGHLIRLNNVEFDAEYLGSTYADAENQGFGEALLTDCDYNTVLVRTSGFADFANETIPSGNGSVIAVVGQHQNTMQLAIRSSNEVELDGERCTAGGEGTYLYKKFHIQELTSGGWKSYRVTSQPELHDWEVSAAGNAGNYYAVASGFNNIDYINSQTELWYISPSMDLSNASVPVLSFKNAKNYPGPALKLLASSDYDGFSNPAEQGTWTDYSQLVNWSTGGFNWINSDFPITQFNGDNNVHIAFKYTSTMADAATWEIDDIVIMEEQ